MTTHTFTENTKTQSDPIQFECKIGVVRATRHRFIKSRANPLQYHTRLNQEIWVNWSDGTESSLGPAISDIEFATGDEICSVTIVNGLSIVTDAARINMSTNSFSGLLDEECSVALLTGRRKQVWKPILGAFLLGFSSHGILGDLALSSAITLGCLAIFPWVANGPYEETRRDLKKAVSKVNTYVKVMIV